SSTARYTASSEISDAGLLSTKPPADPARDVTRPAARNSHIKRRIRTGFVPTDAAIKSELTGRSGCIARIRSVCIATENRLLATGIDPHWRALFAPLSHSSSANLHFSTVKPQVLHTRF